MDLHSLAAPAIGMVNPFVPATLLRNSGYETAPDGTRRPRFRQPEKVSAQVQPLSYKDLQHVAGLNLTGEAVAIYVRGKISGESRPDRAGGDLLQIGEKRWLTVQVVEDWPDWVKVVAVRQVAPEPR